MPRTSSSPATSVRISRRASAPFSPSASPTGKAAKLPIAFPPGAFRRENEEDDRLFYAWPRRVVHLDSGAIAVLMRLYEALAPPRGCVLDLMSSWRSHLPASFAGTLIGVGLNRDEMRENPQLAQAVVHDLNREPKLPFNDGRSEEHTSELQSRPHLVCRLLLEKKKKTKTLAKNAELTALT